LGWLGGVGLRPWSVILSRFDSAAGANFGGLVHCPYRAFLWLQMESGIGPLFSKNLNKKNYAQN